jgi:hypothetical protein
MTNLLDRLKPELLQALEERYNKYPNILQDIKNDLANNVYFTDVRYGTYAELYYLTKQVFGSYEMNFGYYFTNK